MRRATPLLLLVAALVAACMLAACVTPASASPSRALPSFPVAPTHLAALVDLDDATPEAHAEGETEAEADHDDSALVEVDSAESSSSLQLDSSLPSSELALASLLPNEAKDPITAALALEVPDPNTFLKDDVFLQSLERAAQKKEEEAARAAGVTESATAAATTTPAAAESASAVAAAPKTAQSGSDLERYVRDRLKAEVPEASSLPSTSNPGVVARRSPASSAQNEAAPAMQQRDRRFAGEHEAASGGLFPSHRRGPLSKRLPLHDQAPHQEAISRRFRSAQGQFQRENAEWKDTTRPSLKHNQFPHHGGHTPAAHNKGRPLARVNLPKPEESRHLRAASERSFPARMGPTKNRRLQLAARDRAMKQAAARAERKQSVKLAKAAKKAVSLAEMGSRMTVTASASAARPRPQLQSGGVPSIVPVQATHFQRAFDHVRETRRELRAQSRRFAEEERAALAMQADADRLTALQKQRQDVLDAHTDAAIKARANLHTMVGASNGVFDRLPAHATHGRRGSMANKSWTPARRIVPQRLARLEDARMLARRRSFSRGNMADTYHKQLHNQLLGVGGGPSATATPMPAALGLIEMDAQGVVHDRQ